MTTSGAPLPAVTAVWNLSYSSPPAPGVRPADLDIVVRLVEVVDHELRVRVPGPERDDRARRAWGSCWCSSSAWLEPPSPSLVAAACRNRACPARGPATLARTCFVFTVRFLSDAGRHQSVQAHPRTGVTTKGTSLTCSASWTRFHTLYFQRCRSDYRGAPRALSRLRDKPPMRVRCVCPGGITSHRQTGARGTLRSGAHDGLRPRRYTLSRPLCGRRAMREIRMGATMHDVARVAGVSVKTVSNVINDYPYVRPGDPRTGALGDRRSSTTAPISRRAGCVRPQDRGHRARGCRSCVRTTSPNSPDAVIRAAETARRRCVVVEQTSADLRRRDARP